MFYLCLAEPAQCQRCGPHRMMGALSRTLARCWLVTTLVWSASGSARARQPVALAQHPGDLEQNEFSDRFHNLEVQLADQFNVLKTMILNLEDKMGAMERADGQLFAAISRFKCAGGESEQSAEDEVPALDEEIRRLNNTLHYESNSTIAGCGYHQIVFTYYWQVGNMDYKLTTWDRRRSLRSPSFYVWPGGYRMYLRIYPRHSGDAFYIHVGLTRGENDSALEWPFRLKHRLAVLDQVNVGVPGHQDLVSRLWDPGQLCSEYNWQRPAHHPPDNHECVGLGFPQAVLRNGGYIRKDAVMLKLTVCVDHLYRN